MRRSAAPSFHSSAKRLRFLSPFMNTTSEIDKEDDVLDYMDPEIAADFKLLNSNESKSENNVPERTNAETDGTSASEILNLILGAVNETETNTSQASLQILPCDNLKYDPCFNNSPSQPSSELKDSSNENHLKYKNMPSENHSSNLDSESSVSCYNVLWCKRSGKKRKIWEGDGVLIVKNRSAVLKDSEGKVIDRGIGYKLKDVSSLEEGSNFYIGGKECEIQSLISSEFCAKVNETDEINENSLVKKPPQLPMLKNTKRLKPCM